MLKNLPLLQIVMALKINTNYDIDTSYSNNLTIGFSVIIIVLIILDFILEYNKNI